MTIAIRVAAPLDIPAIMVLFRQSEALHVQNRPDLFSVADEAEVVASFETFFADPKSTSLILEQDGSVIGYCRYSIWEVPRKSFLTRKGQKQATLEEIVVSNLHRRKGLAKRMVAEVEVRARREGAKFIHLNVFTFNAPAQNLYRELGFIENFSQLGKAL